MSLVALPSGGKGREAIRRDPVNLQRITGQLAIVAILAIIRNIQAIHMDSIYDIAAGCGRGDLQASTEDAKPDPLRGIGRGPGALQVCESDSTRRHANPCGGARFLRSEDTHVSAQQPRTAAPLDQGRISSYLEPKSETLLQNEQ